LAPLVGIGATATADIRVVFVDGSMVTVNDVTPGSAIEVRDTP
jgi:hypothetical protein